MLSLLLGACARDEPEPISSTPTQAELDRLEAVGACIYPIKSATSEGSIFFPTPTWGLTAGHCLEDAPDGAKITFRVAGVDSPLELQIDAKSGALDKDRDPDDDWAVLRVVGEGDNPVGDCAMTLDAEHRPKPGEVVYTLGLLAPDFKEYDESGEVRVFRLIASGPPRGETDRETFVWMRWPHDFAPHGFSGGPVYADVEGELRVIGLNIMAIQREGKWWVVARRLTPEVVAYARGADAP